MMPWLLIGLVVFAIISSVLWLKPSPRDQHLSALRMAALKQGLQIRQYTFKPRSEKNGIRDELRATSYSVMRVGAIKPGLLRYRIVRQAGWMQEDLPEGYAWHDEATAAERGQLLAAWPMLKDTLLMLEVYEHRVGMMVAEDKAADAENYRTFIDALMPSQ
ncbi:MAG: hypothetical protein IBX52_00885 [Bacterioplanes sp.]|nr:hypothetical protein [Bacterioplanes sp.]